MTNRELSLWDKQYKFLTSTKKSVLLQCGIGFGKTFVDCVFVLNSLQTYKNCNYMFVARDMPQFKKAILPEMMTVLEIFNYKEGADYILNRSSMEFYFKKEKVTMFCVGATNYDSAFRGPNIAIMIADEVEYYKREAWYAMLGRLRVYPELLRCSSTPNGFNFVSEYFVDNDDDTKEVLVAPTFENKSLSDQYVKTLKQTYSPKMYEQEVLAKRLNLKLGQVYDEFDRNIHVKECKSLLEDNDQLYFFTDYNISNYCGTYMIMKDDVVYAIGEEHLRFKGSQVMAKTVKAKYPDRPVIVVGDSTGNNKRDVAIDRTNYEHFRREGLLTKAFRNPPVESRIIAAQSHLHHKKLVVDPSCKTLIKDLELLSWKEDGTGIDKSNIELSHAADAWNYGVWFFMPIKRQNVTPITLG